MVRLVYVGAVPRQVGSAERYPGFLDPDPVIHVDREQGTFVLDDDWWVNEEAGTTFPAEVQDHVRRHPRRAQAIRAVEDPIPAAAWTTIPATVLLGRDDDGFYPGQRVWLATTFDDVRDIEGDHFTLFRNPEVIADVVIEALEAARHGE